MEREEQLGAKEIDQMAWQYRTRGGGLERDNFPVLTTMAKALRIIGWLAVAGGAFLAVFQVLPWFLCITGGGKVPSRGFGAQSCGVALLILAPMLGSLVAGFCLVAFGEVIGVFRGIEGNTHQLLSRIEQAGLQSKLTGEGRQS